MNPGGLFAAPPSPDQVTLSEASRIEFRALKVHRLPGKDPLLVCVEVGHYMEVEEDTLKAVEALAKAPSIGEAERALAAATGETYDLVALADLLLTRGFVARVDGRDVEAAAPRAKGRNLFSWVSPRAARLVRHPVTLALVAFLALQYALGLLAGMIPPPSYRDALVTPERPLLNVALVMGGMLAMAYVHELAHYFTARSYGLDPKIAFSHRFYAVVLTTDVTDAWTLPRRPQLAIFCAGVLLNLAVMGACGLLLGLHDADLVALSQGWLATLRLVVLVNAFPLVFQLFLIARTDLYYVLQSLTGNRSLSQDSRAYVRMRLARLWSLLRRRPHAPCPRCAAKRFPTEPFCVRCGEPQAVQNPNLYPFRHEQRRVLVGFGVLSTLGFAVMGPLLVLMLVRFFLMEVAIAALLPELARERDWTRLGEALAAAALLGMGLVFAVQAASMLLLMPLRLGWFALVRRLPTLPARAQRAVLLILNLQVAWRATRAARFLQRVLRPAPGPNARPRWADADASVHERSGSP